MASPFPFADPGDPLGGNGPLLDATPMPSSFLAGITNPGPAGADASEHDANLADLIDESELRTCANRLIEAVKRDRQSRENLDRLLDDGIRRLGFDRTEETRSDYFEGGSAVVHPLMAHAIVDFQARAMKEIFPAKGPVRTEIVGERQRLDADTLAKAERVRRLMNFQVTRKCREWRSSVDEMLMHLPLSGTGISKITWDHQLRRPRRENVPIGYFHCPLGIDSLERAPRYSHEMRLWPEEVRAYQEAGLWRDIALEAPNEEQPAEHEERSLKILGEERPPGTEDDRHTILEIHVDYAFRTLREPGPSFPPADAGAAAGSSGPPFGGGDMPDMVDIDMDGVGEDMPFDEVGIAMSIGDEPISYDDDYADADAEPGHVHYPEGAPPDDDYEHLCPYIITLEESTATVLAVRRNWKAGDDEAKTKRIWFQARRLFPWKGIWGIGLFHMLGGLGAAATGALRALMDSAMIHNMPMGLRLRSGKASAQRVRLAPLTLAEIDAPGATDIREVAMALPFNGPSPVLFELMKEIVTVARQFATVATQEIVEAGPNMPVGTVLALIEQGSMVYSAIHARLHYAQGEELEILHDLNGEFLDDMETFRDFGGEMVAYRQDFDGQVDIIPVSDPAIFSQVQRAAQAQAKLDLALQAQQAGVKVDMRAAFIDVARTLNLPGVEETFPAPEEAVPLDPVSEFAALIQGKPVKAFPGQNHLAHLTALRAAVADPQYAMMMERLLPQVLALAGDHASLLRREEIERSIGQPLPPPGAEVPPEIAYLFADAQAEAADQIARARPPIEGYGGQEGEDAAAMLLAQAEMLKAQNEVEKVKSTERIKTLEFAAKKEGQDADIAADLTKIAAQLKADKEEKTVELQVKLAEINAKLQSALTIAREQRASAERIASGNIASKIAVGHQALQQRQTEAAAKPKPKPNGKAAA